jgi:hypothetical protein
MDWHTVCARSGVLAGARQLRFDPSTLGLDVLHDHGPGCPGRHQVQDGLLADPQGI